MTLGVDFKGYADNCAKQRRRVRESFQTEEERGKKAMFQEEKT